MMAQPSHKHEHNHDHKKSHLTDKTKSNLISRLNRIEGQLRGVKNMVDSNVYCDNVLNVVASIQSALAGFSSLLLENHLKNCVFSHNSKKDMEALEELMPVIHRLIK